MSFDSSIFIVFFAAFFVVYHLCFKSFRAQNMLILIGSYVFYGWWDWKLLWLIITCTAANYIAGMMLSRQARPAVRKTIVATCAAISLGILGVFKYFNFFAAGLEACLNTLGINAGLPTLRLILPIGISFYTFQSLAYTIDIYRGRIEPERNPVTFFAFIAFFPQLVAGPIERASRLLPQFNRPRTVSEPGMREAIWMICWGFFLKTVVSDTLSIYSDYAFSESASSGMLTIAGVIAFSIQIYCDFHSYSIIARGTARMLGFELIWNFNQPYFAVSLQDFWRRWHISLSTWLRDYLYISLGGNRRGRARTYINLLLTMLLGGLWHGAAWNFVFWGLLHGVALAVERFFRESRTGKSKMPSILSWAATMILVATGWFFFRCDSWSMITAMAGSLLNLSWDPFAAECLLGTLAVALPVAALEIWTYRAGSQLAPAKLNRFWFAVATGLVMIFVFITFNRSYNEFIYFQF